MRGDKKPKQEVQALAPSVFTSEPLLGVYALPTASGHATRSAKAAQARLEQTSHRAGALLAVLADYEAGDAQMEVQRS